MMSEWTPQPSGLGLARARRWLPSTATDITADVLKQAVRGAKGTTDPIELIVSNDNEFRTVRLDYHDGEKYPRLERVQGTPDLLDEIIKPLAAGKGSGL